MARCRISANLSLMATVMIICEYLITIDAMKTIISLYFYVCYFLFSVCLGNSLTDAIVPFDKILRSRSVPSSPTDLILTKTMMQNLGKLDITNCCSVFNCGIPSVNCFKTVA